MGCNAWNHPPDCRCGWGGDGHSGKSPGGWHHNSLDRRGRLEKAPGSRLVSCPKCGGGVYHIKHNGGVVWLDPPLSPPWYKHPCFDTLPRKNKGRNEMPLRSRVTSEELKSCKIGVVSSFRSGSLVFETGGGGNVVIYIAGNPASIVGEVCVFNQESNKLWTVKNPNRVYSSIGGAVKGTSSAAKPNNVAKSENCFLCSTLVRDLQRLVKHLKKVHSCSALMWNGKITGVVYDKIEKINDENKSPSEDLKTAVLAIISSGKKGQEWMSIDILGSLLKTNFPSIRPKKYGYKNLTELVYSQPYLEVKGCYPEEHNGVVKTMVKAKVV